MTWIFLGEAMTLILSLNKHRRWLKYDVVTPSVCAAVFLYWGLWLIVKTFLLASLSLCTRLIVVCKDHVLAYHRGIPLSDYRLHPSPDPPTAASSPFTFRLSPCASNRVETGTSHPSYVCTHSFLLCSGACRTGAGLGLHITFHTDNIPCVL